MFTIPLTQRIGPLLILTVRCILVYKSILPRMVVVPKRPVPWNGHLLKRYVYDKGGLNEKTTDSRRI